MFRSFSIVEESFDPDVTEGCDFDEENCAVEPIYAEIPAYTFNEVDQLQGRDMPGYISKLLISH